jgi:hypothetical protein
MSTAPTPLTTIATDTAALEAQLKSSFATLSTDAKTGLTEALADAHKEITDLQGAGTSVWSAILAALGKA